MSVIRSLAIWLVILASAFAALGRLLVAGARALIGRDGTLVQRLTGVATTPQGLRDVFAVLRGLAPSLALRTKLIKCYDNSGTAIVTRATDIREVLSNDEDFEVVYGPRMRQITAGRDFFLGMQDIPDYTRDVSNMRLVVRRADVPEIIKPFVETSAADIVARAGGRIDVPAELSAVIPARLMDAYFGTPGPSQETLIAWTTVMFAYLFTDLTADPDLGRQALEAAAGCRAYLDERIAERKATSATRDQVLDRCLALQKAGTPGMDDVAIRDNLIGLLIGAIPTTSKAAVLALDGLLDRPGALSGAQAAARADDDAMLAAYVFEALRFNPMSPMVYRRAIRDTVVAKGTLRALTVPKSSMILAVTQSAMFDPAQVPSPGSFRIDREWDEYVLWGYGLHSCFGAHLNRVTIPSILKPLLQRPNLRRAEGAVGQIDSAGTPFPAHFTVEFDA